MKIIQVLKSTTLGCTCINCIMKFAVGIAFVVLAVATVQGQFNVDESKKLAECMASEADAAKLKADVLAGKVVEMYKNANLKCFHKCAMQKFKVLKGDKLDESKVADWMKKYHNLAVSHANFESCVNKNKQADDCEKFKKIFLCLRNKATK